MALSVFPWKKNMQRHRRMGLNVHLDKFNQIYKTQTCKNYRRSYYCFVCLNENPKEENIQAFCILENVFVISDLICSCAETLIPVLQLQRFQSLQSKSWSWNTFSMQIVWMRLKNDCLGGGWCFPAKHQGQRTDWCRWGKGWCWWRDASHQLGSEEGFQRRGYHPTEANYQINQSAHTGHRL